MYSKMGTWWRYIPEAALEDCYIAGLQKVVLLFPAIGKSAQGKRPKAQGFRRTVVLYIAPHKNLLVSVE